MEKTKAPTELLSVGEFARRLGVSRALAYKIVAAGRVPIVRYSERTIRVSASALDPRDGRDAAE